MPANALSIHSNTATTLSGDLMDSNLNHMKLGKTTGEAELAAV